MELMGHFKAGYDTRGLDLIRRMWGFMLASPIGTRSTIWEGFNSDGSFADQGPFQSLAHAWGSGPTSALTFHVLGVEPDTATGRSYHVIPHPGDLRHAEGNLTLGPGRAVYVNYDVGATCQTFSMWVDARTHTGSTGRIGVPRFGTNHTVLIDGAVAWNGASFLGSPGISGASQDADSISFTGVQPGARTFSYSDGTSCPGAPEQWSFCADENGSCSFSGTKRVRYGKRGRYQYAIATGGVSCNNATFGDPIVGVAKSCQYSNELYTACANEGQTCTFSGTRQVRFGANGQWVTRVASGSAVCNVATFGDPLPNVIKRCEHRALP